MSGMGFAKDTSKRTTKEWIQGIIVLFIGLTIAHLGVSLFLISSLGSDTFTIFIQGISIQVGLSIGTCHVIALILLMIVMTLTTKGYVKAGTVVCAFCGGWIIDFFLWAFGDMVQATSPLWLRLLVMLAGCVILSFGMSIVIKSNTGTGPNDLIAIILTDMVNKKRTVEFRTVRICCDIFFVALGFLAGATVGIGTIAALVLIGPCVQFFLPKSESIIQKVCPGL